MISINELINEMEVYGPRQCGYFSDKSEYIRAFRCPDLPNEYHAELAERGFRHSGDAFYFPECPDCRQCHPMRIDPLQFRPSKKQRHILNKNRDIRVFITPPKASQEALNLFNKYTAYKHPNSPQISTLKKLQQLLGTLPSSVSVRYILDGKLVGVTAADLIPNRAFLSDYHFFDPDFAKRSIGVFSMLFEIMLTKQFKIPYFYPGFWLPDCPKMKYKANYRPNQLFIDGSWQDNPFI